MRAVVITCYSICAVIGIAIVVVAGYFLYAERQDGKKRGPYGIMPDREKRKS